MRSVAAASAVLSLGVVDGRNIWKTDLTGAERLIERARMLHGDALMVAPTCSLLHVPVDLATETKLDRGTRGWLAFARQKLDEVATLAKAANGARDMAIISSDNAQRRGQRAARRRASTIRR